MSKSRVWSADRENWWGLRKEGKREIRTCQEPGGLPKAVGGWESTARACVEWIMGGAKCQVYPHHDHTHALLQPRQEVVGSNAELATTRSALSSASTELAQVGGRALCGGGAAGALCACGGGGRECDCV